jgi:hypothetical protein
MKSTFFVKGAALTMAIGIALPAMAQDKPVTLARIYKAGDTAKYSATINTNTMGMDIVVKTGYKATIKEVKPNGDVIIEQITEAGTVSMSGMDQEIPGGEKSVETRDKLGKLIEIKLPESAQSVLSPEVQKLAAITADVLLSGKEVKAGDTWSTEFDNPILKGKKFSVKTTYIGTEKLDGKELWKIKQLASVDVDDQGAKTVQDTITWLDPANGQMVKMEGTVKGIQTMFGPMDWNMKMALVKGDKPAK